MTGNINMQTKIIAPTRHKFPYTVSTPQYLGVCDNWRDYVTRYSYLETSVKNYAHRAVTKAHYLQCVLNEIIKLDDKFGRNTKLMGIAKLRKKYIRLLTSFPQTVE